MTCAIPVAHTKLEVCDSHDPHACFGIITLKMLCSTHCRQVPDLSRAESSIPNSPRHKHARHEDKPKPSATAAQSSSRLTKPSSSRKLPDLPDLPVRSSKQRSSGQPSSSATATEASYEVKEVTWLAAYLYYMIHTPAVMSTKCNGVVMMCSESSACFHWCHVTVASCNAEHGK